LASFLLSQRQDVMSRGSALDPEVPRIAQEHLRYNLAPGHHDLQGYIPATENGRMINTCRFVIDVCEAGGYRAYVSWTAPRQDLLAFRVLVERGRARARDALLGRAFGLPKELFCVVVSFWTAQASWSPSRGSCRTQTTSAGW
jgi:hypothetical protein